MAHFIIKDPNNGTKWIKNVDGANGTIEFQDSSKDAYYRDSGFFADSEFEFIKFHFIKQYPELEYMQIDNGWGSSYVPGEGDAEEGDAVGVAVHAVEEVGEAVAGA